MNIRSVSFSLSFFVFLGIALALSVIASHMADSEPGEILLTDNKLQKEAQKRRLTFFGNKTSKDNLTAIEKVLRGFMAENPDIIISYEGVQGEQYWDTLNRRLETGGMDDMMMLHHDYVIRLGAHGKLADMGDLAAAHEFSALMRDQFQEAKGLVHFLPTTLSTYNLYANENLLKKHGQKIPRNLEEFAAVCDYFVNQGIVPIVANRFASLRHLIAAKGLYPLYRQKDPGGEIEKFNTGEQDIVEFLKPGVELVAHMRDRGWIDPAEVLDTTHGKKDLEIFSKGERPFLIGGGWTEPRLAALRPKFQYSLYPFPLLSRLRN